MVVSICRGQCPGTRHGLSRSASVQQSWFQNCCAGGTQRQEQEDTDSHGKGGTVTSDQPFLQWDDFHSPRVPSPLIPDQGDPCLLLCTHYRVLTHLLH